VDARHCVNRACQSCLDKTKPCPVLFEILKLLPIHPIQYTLVGLALALFFLLLVSLSEHIAFAHAYPLAGGGLCLLYHALFGLLQSESNALIMGSTLLLALLVSIMVVTRKVTSINWALRLATKSPRKFCGEDDE
jgi:inner membrane protein involved in colicin E2 resistance